MIGGGGRRRGGGRGEGGGGLGLAANGMRKKMTPLPVVYSCHEYIEATVVEHCVEKPR